MSPLRSAANSGVSLSTLAETERWRTESGPLERQKLKDVTKDTRTRGFCGPTAVAAVTGAPLSIVRDAFRMVRHGSGWTEMDQAPAIRGTSNTEVRQVARTLGYSGTWYEIAGNPTFAKWSETRTGAMRTHPCIVEVTRHYVTVSGWTFCDTLSGGLVVDIENAPGRRKRVKRVFVFQGRVSPLAVIPRKENAASKARAASAARDRATFARKVKEIGAIYRLEAPSDTRDLEIVFADGRRLWMRHEGCWPQNLSNLDLFLSNPSDSTFTENGDNSFWTQL